MKKKVTEIRDINTSKLIRGHTIRCENVESDSMTLTMTLSMWQYQTCKNHKESKCFKILYHNGYFHIGTAFVWQTLPRLKALCLSTTPNIIFEATVKDTWSKADDIFNFQCSQSKTTKKPSIPKTTFGATGHSLSTRKHFQSCQVDC